VTTKNEEKIVILREAFQRFNSASRDLEQSYHLMEIRVKQLTEELRKSSDENNALRQKAERDARIAAAGEMAIRMAHELRNPLGSIELFAGLLRNHLAGNPEKKSWADHISAAVASMDYVLTNLLLFTGKPKAEFRFHDLNRLLEEARNFTLPLLIQNGIEVAMKLEKNPEPVRCDDALLKQVFLNLILNAADAMPNGGRLELSTERKEADNRSSCRITISDSGEGIPESVRGRIFDPFFTTKQKGTGLGLSIVHNAVEAHGGTIDFVSEPGKGTRFTITFPSEGADPLPGRSGISGIEAYEEHP
jgi:signal transduction histidine kinase